MNNGQQGTPFLPVGAGFTVTQRSLNLSLLSSDLASSDLDLSSLVISLRYHFDTAQYALFPYLHRVEPPPNSPSVSSTSSFGYDPEMPKPERGTPEYAAYKQAKKDRKAEKERGKSNSQPSNSLTVERPSSRAGSEYSYVSSIGSGDEGNTRSLNDKKGSGETKDRGFSGYAGVQGYVSVGGSGGIGGGIGGGYQGSSYVDNSGGGYGQGQGASGKYSPVSPVSSEGKPYVAPQYNYPPQGVQSLPPPPQGQYPPPGPGQFPPPSPGIYSPQPQNPPSQYGAQLAPYAGYGYPPPPQGAGYPPPLPPPSPGPYTTPQISAPPPLDPQYAPALPGFGAGAGVFPPGQTPPQYNNPDYYGDTQTTTSTTANTSQHQHSSSTSSINVQYAQSYSAPPTGHGKTNSVSTYQIPPPPPPSQYPGHSSSGSISAGQGSIPPLPQPSQYPGHSSSGSISAAQVTIPPPPHLSVLGGGGGSSTSVTIAAPPSPKPFLSGLSIPSLSSLSIGGSSHSSSAGGLPPPSPSLQPYYGTYQSISPLPSPVLSPSGGSSFYSTSSSVSVGGFSLDSSFSLGPSAHPSHGPSLVTPVIPPRPASPPYDPSADAKAILSSLKHFRPSPTPLIQILPTLSPNQIMLLRREYKRIFKQVNVAKHIKTVFASTSFGKLAFAVALGPYESEAWFANCWYQKRETRNELLIEALMGKSNEEIRKIKDGFKDAKYDNSLEKAVRNELVANKFRIAVLAQLEGVRMEELGHGMRFSMDGIRADVRRLGDILERQDGRGGGETVMIEIIVNRSDGWIREMAGMYRNVHGRDLPKAIMRHSKNLVGETLLHVINGAIDKPLRDAKLLEQAIAALMESGREDLLISRCVRVHWDPYHLERVKQAYKRKFKVDLGKRMRDAVVDGIFEDFLVRMVRD